MLKKRHIALVFSTFFLVCSCTIYTSRLALGEKGINRDHQQLTDFPADVLTDTNLTSLSLFDNRLTALPQELEKLQKLEVLYLGRNAFSEFPEVLCKLKSLRILSLAYNDLDSLPDCLCEMERLEWLYLNNNHIVHLPDSMGKLKKLEQLTLKRNVLRSLPEQLYDASALQFLDLSYNELTVIDSSLGKLQHLKELRLYRSGFLLEVPESICSLRFLERLNIDNTVVLPTCIFARKTNRLTIQSTDY